MAESEGLPEVSVPGAFEDLYKDDYAAVVGLVYGLTGNRWVAEDLAQEAFLRAHRDWMHVGGLDSPGGWVRRVAMNLARSRWRRLGVEASARLRMLRQSEETEPETPSQTDVFWREVRNLPPRQAQAVALRYVEDLSVTEIADVLAIADGTVKALLHQGRERLRRQLVARGVVDEV